MARRRRRGNRHVAILATVPDSTVQSVPSLKCSALQLLSGSSTMCVDLDLFSFFLISIYRYMCLAQ